MLDNEFAVKQSHCVAGGVEEGITNGKASRGTVVKGLKDAKLSD